MHEETKLLKKYLREKFPDHIVRVRLIRAANYSYSSDIIKIQTDVPYQTIRPCIKQVTKNIAVYPKGDVATNHNWERSEILGVTDTLVEFIEIEYLQ